MIMAAQTRQQSGQQSLDPMMDFGEQELQHTLHEFLEDDKEENTNIWNFATIAGIAIFFVGMLSIIQLIGLNIGPDLSGFVSWLPLIGGILVTLIGFGYFVGDRKREKQAQKERKRKRADQYDFGYNQKKGDEGFNLKNNLGDNKSQGAESKGRSFGQAHRQSRKLYKSRSSKKIAGVCGGLAEYFGISTTVVRLLFVITFFAGSGTSLLLYIALAIALDKEPMPMDDDYDF